MAFGSTTLNSSIYNIPKTPVPKEKKDLCNYHRPNYLSILVLNMQPLLGKYLHARILMHCFQRYWWSKNLAIWLDKSILHKLEEQTFSKIRGLNWKIKNCNVFHFRFFPAKSNEKILWEAKQKKNILAPFRPLLPISGKQEFLWKTCLSLFSIYRILFLYRISEKIFQEKLVTDIQMDGHTNAWANIKL